MRIERRSAKVTFVWEWEPEALVSVSALGVTCAAAGWLAVALVRTRRRWRSVRGERGWLLERESAARTAVAAERDRIARELHDIVSHSVSLMVVQAGAAREVLGPMPDEAAAALRAVEDAGRGAMTDLRHLLGLLAPSQNGEDTDHEDLDLVEGAGGDRGVTGPAPQPGLDRLGPLVDRRGRPHARSDTPRAGSPDPAGPRPVQHRTGRRTDPERGHGEVPRGPGLRQAGPP